MTGARRRTESFARCAVVMRSSESDVISTIILRLLKLGRQLPPTLNKPADLLRQLPLFLCRELRPHARQRRGRSGPRRSALARVFDRAVINPRNTHAASRARRGRDSPTAKVFALKCACTGLRSEQIHRNRRSDLWPNAGSPVHVRPPIAQQSDQAHAPTGGQRPGNSRHRAGDAGQRPGSERLDGLHQRHYAMIGDPTLGDAILDRVIHRSHRIELKGESLRKRQALAALGSLTNAKEK